MSVVVRILQSRSQQIKVFEAYHNANNIELVTLLVLISTHLPVSCISLMHLHIGIVGKRSNTTLMSLLQASQVNFDAHLMI